MNQMGNIPYQTTQFAQQIHPFMRP